MFDQLKNKMQPRNPNAVIQNTIMKQVISTVYMFPLFPYQCAVDCGTRKRVECKVWGVKKVECCMGNVVCRV